MAIRMTPEEMQLVKEGKKTIQDIIAERGAKPQVEEETKKEVTELDKVKRELKNANKEYQDAIKENKDLYAEFKLKIKANQERKESARKLIETLRYNKQRLLGNTQ